MLHRESNQRCARLATHVPPPGNATPECAAGALPVERAAMLRQARRHARCRAALRAALSRALTRRRELVRRRPGRGEGGGLPKSLALCVRECFLHAHRVRERVDILRTKRKTKGAVHLGAGRFRLCAASTPVYLTAPTAHPVEPGARRGRCRSALLQERGGESASKAIPRARSLARAGVRAPRSCQGGPHGTVRRT